MVKPLEESEVEETPVIVMPEDFKRPQSPYLVCEVIKTAEDSVFELQEGTKIAIERRMLNEIVLKEGTIYLVLENYVYGEINND